MNVLILEDDSALRFALSQIMEQAGHIVFEAHDIETACAILDQEKLDLLLLDLMIGRNYSIQVADLAGYRAPEAEIIYLTGSNKFPQGELFKISRNASWILRKPVNFRELADMVSHIDSTSKRTARANHEQSNTLH